MNVNLNESIAGNSLSQWQLAMRQFGQSRSARVCLWILGIFYLLAIFADFLAPYSFKNENRDFSYCPPMAINVVNQSGLTWPFVRQYQLRFDQYHKRIYEPVADRQFPIKLLVQGDEYKFLGLIPLKVHLFGVDEPGRIYLLGADSRGRDLYSRILHGARISLSIGLIGVAISFSLGLLIGGLAGYYGGKIDNVLMRVCEMFMMVPGFYLLLALRSVVPDNFNSVQLYFSIVIILSFIGWAGLARVIRGMSLSLKEREYVLAAKALGYSDLQIIVRHVLPHTFSYSIIAIMLSIPGYILGESALSLLGMGIQDPYASWGNLLSEAIGIVQIQFAPWILIPGGLILVTVICFNVIGDALRDAVDPRFRAEEIHS